MESVPTWSKSYTGVSHTNLLEHLSSFWLEKKKKKQFGHK